MSVDISQNGRHLISRILGNNSKKFNRIISTAQRIVFIEKVTKQIINEYLKTNNPVYEISSEDSCDGTRTFIKIPKIYILEK